jgi:predicted lactoylglutathione lyase
MSTKIAVNTPVKDLAESGRFFAGLGFPINEQLANENTEAHVISDDIYVLLVGGPGGRSSGLRVTALSPASGR